MDPRRLGRFTASAALAAAVAATGCGRRPPAPAAPPSLTAADYIEIQQLVARYALAVTHCTNSGYDYADLFTEDGWFSPSRDGSVGTKWQGRDRLAEAAGGGPGGCREVSWKGVSHILANHVVTPSPEGARGRVDLIAVGVDQTPNKLERQGHYEDVYVRTPKGWRFKSRLHVLTVQ
jgi:hypothetical protein